MTVLNNHSKIDIQAVLFGGTGVFVAKRNRIIKSFSDGFDSTRSFPAYYPQRGDTTFAFGCDVCV